MSVEQEAEQHEYVHSPVRIEATKATEHTLDRAQIYQLLTAAMQPLGIKPPSRRDPIPLARKVHAKAHVHVLGALDALPPPLQLALSIAQAQDARDIWHKNLLLPAVLQLDLIRTDSAAKMIENGRR